MKKQSKKQASPMLAAQPKIVELVNSMEIPEGVDPANVVIVTPEPEMEDKVLTKRNRVATSTLLEASGKKVNVRTGHTQWTWEVMAKILPATAAELVKALEDAPAEKGIKEKCGGLNSHVSYYIRRGWLAPVKQD